MNFRRFNSQKKLNKKEKNKRLNSGGPNPAHGLAQPAWPNGQNGPMAQAGQHMARLPSARSSCSGPARVPTLEMAIRWDAMVVESTCGARPLHRTRWLVVELIRMRGRRQGGNGGFGRRHSDVGWVSVISGDRGGVQHHRGREE
jgi:hypothetical protein